MELFRTLDSLAVSHVHPGFSNRCCGRSNFSVKLIWGINWLHHERLSHCLELRVPHSVNRGFMEDETSAYR
jgi:hypothetical protein